MQAIGELTGGIAHDFNNLLAIIIGNLQLLEESLEDNPEHKELIADALWSVERGSELTSRLLAFARRQHLKPEMTDVNEVIRGMTNLLRRTLGERIKIIEILAEDLGNSMIDRGQLENAVLNLVVNARDAMKNGGVLTISTRNATLEPNEDTALEHAAGDYTVVEVHDTGIGMPPEVQARIFEPFFSTKDVGKGTGLGLSTVYGIVKQTGAHIFFDSTVGKGTVFRIFLPRYVPAEGEAVVQHAEAGPEIADLTGSATILLVEDEEAVRAFAARALASRGYKVYEAGSGVEALEVMEEAGGKIDLVVSDVVMPELDGPSLLKELRKQRPELKIIFISGYAEDAFKKNLPEGEIFHFLPKPFSLKQLAVAVKETLGR
ncbi:MAG: response regulator [Rhodospirillales bacterium]|nr:response regulator [Rhodospirillales bacterium]